MRRIAPDDEAVVRGQIAQVDGARARRLAEHHIGRAGVGEVALGGAGRTDDQVVDAVAVHVARRRHAPPGPVIQRPAMDRKALIRRQIAQVDRRSVGFHIGIDQQTGVAVLVAGKGFAIDRRAADGPPTEVGQPHHVAGIAKHRQRGHAPGRIIGQVQQIAQGEPQRVAARPRQVDALDALHDRRRNGGEVQHHARPVQAQRVPARAAVDADEGRVRDPQHIVARARAEDVRPAEAGQRIVARPAAQHLPGLIAGRARHRYRIRAAPEGPTEHHIGRAGIRAAVVAVWRTHHQVVIAVAVHVAGSRHAPPRPVARGIAPDDEAIG